MFFGFAIAANDDAMTSIYLFLLHFIVAIVFKNF